MFSFILLLQFFSSSISRDLIVESLGSLKARQKVRNRHHIQVESELVFMNELFSKFVCLVIRDFDFPAAFSSCIWVGLVCNYVLWFIPLFRCAVSIAYQDVNDTPRDIYQHSLRPSQYRSSQKCHPSCFSQACLI